MAEPTSNDGLARKCVFIFGVIILFVFVVAAVQDENELSQELALLNAIESEDGMVEIEYIASDKKDEVAKEEESELTEVKEMAESVKEEAEEIAQIAKTAIDNAMDEMEEVADIDNTVVAMKDQEKELYEKSYGLSKGFADTSETLLEKTRAVEDEALVQEVEEFLDTHEMATVCELPQLGIQFACDPNWPVVPSEEGEERVLIKKDPYITMGIKKLDENFRFLPQLSKMYFEKTGLYKKGFRTENVEFAGHDAVMVKALSAFKETTQRRDYFFIHDDTTVHISFMLPNTEWTPDVQDKLQQITKSFESYSAQ